MKVNRKMNKKNCDEAWHSPETKKENEVEIVCHKPTQGRVLLCT
jgi:hypothetical protein